MGRYLILPCSCALVFLAGGAHALPDAYVQAIQADVAEFDTGSFNAPGDTAWIGDDAAASDSTSTLEGFESFLKESFRGTFILYRSLPEAQRIQVWQDYVATGDLGSMRIHIFKLRSQNLRSRHSRRPPPPRRAYE